jgi:antitoxin (DNA-binding transcriptional repressor) of toxin-antitoxin stability system
VARAAQIENSPGSRFLAFKNEYQPSGVTGTIAASRLHGYYSQMEKTNISNLKNQLSSYLRKVRSGESVLVLDRNVPIARIERVAPPQTDERFAKLESAGLIRRPSKPLPLKKLVDGMPHSRASVLEALLDERAEDR